MNEKIKELAEQAGMPTITATRLGVQATLYDKNLLDVEKFAELIVKECVKIADNHYDTKSAIHNIKEHFGVEE